MCDFDWDPAKSAKNLRKHGVDFKLAKTVFGDELLSSIPDGDSEFEERWTTIGEAQDGQLLVVCYTKEETAGGYELIRVISARKPTPNERRNYESGE
ncbi:MAG: BrnT family toxin [Gammaproteobacteria bacterium]|nr:BrnT family toxin [Gammaproteobacteria bacterium]MYK47907.1 BrnT family toxin [Gammaproteobacteria bacterium]